MKKLMIAAFASLVCAGLLFCNDSAVAVASGFPGTMEAVKNGQIEMRSEHVRMTLGDGACLTEAEFEFVNHGGAIDVDIAFPQWQWGTREDGEFKELKAYLDGKEQTLTIVQAKPGEEREGSKINKWFVRKIHFDEKATVKTSVIYRTAIGYGSVSYLFGTGSNWRGPIGRAVFEIVKDDDTWINAVVIPGYIDGGESRNASFNPSIVKGMTIATKGRSTTITLDNLAPGPWDFLTLQVDGAPSAIMWIDTPQSEFESWLTRHSVEYLPSWLLAFRTARQLDLEKNLVLASHGNIPDSKETLAWIREKSGGFYKPAKKVSRKELNAFELENLKAIEAEEARRKKK